MPLFSDLLKQAATLNAGSPATDDVVKEFVANFQKLTTEEKADVAKQAMDAIKASPDLLAHFQDKNLSWNATAFAFQTVVRAIELDDGKDNNTFPKFSTFTSKKHPGQHHPDGLFGPLTNDVYLGKNAGAGKKNALIALAEKATGKSAQYAVADDLDPTDITGRGNKGAQGNQTQNVQTQHVETPEEKTAREAREAKQRLEDEAKKPKKATAEDVEKYTFKRAQVQYYEEVLAENPAAKGFNQKQLEAISEAVHNYAFNADGTLKTHNTDGRKINYGSEIVTEQLRAEVRKYTHELGVTDAQIAKLTFTANSTPTRTLIGSYTAAENAMLNADKVLSKNAEILKEHFNKAGNKEFLESQGIKAEYIPDLANVDESQRAVSFKTNFIPALHKLVDKEAGEIQVEYAKKIKDEQDKLLKYDVLDKVVEMGFPTALRKQKLDADNKPVFEIVTKQGYAKDGTPIETKEQKSIMYDAIDEAKSWAPIKPNLQDKATQEALKSLKMINEKGEYLQLTKTVIKDGKAVEEAITYKDQSGTEKPLTADIALADPKQYNQAIKDHLSTVYKFTPEEVKRGAYDGGNIDEKIIHKKIDIDKKKDTDEVDKNVKALIKERDVKIENSPSNILLHNALDEQDSKRLEARKKIQLQENGIKKDEKGNDIVVTDEDRKLAKETVTSVLGKYEEANVFYKAEADYETHRRKAELTGKGVSKGFLNIGKSEYKDLQHEADKIEKMHKNRVEATQTEIDKLNQQIAVLEKPATDKDKDKDKKAVDGQVAVADDKEAGAKSAQIAALKSRLDAANANLKALTEIPKNIDQGDQVSLINIDNGSSHLIHVDAKTKKEQKKAAADLKKEEEEKQKASKPAVPGGSTGTPKPAEGTVPAAGTATPPAVPAAGAGTPTAEHHQPRHFQTAIGELDGNVTALVSKIQKELDALPDVAKAVNNPYDNVSDKKSNQNWNNAVEALNKDLKALRELDVTDVTGATTGNSMEETLKKAKSLGIEVTDKFEVDKTQTIQNVKDKSKNTVRE